MELKCPLQDLTKLINIPLEKVGKAMFFAFKMGFIGFYEALASQKKNLNWNTVQAGKMSRN